MVKSKKKWDNCEGCGRKWLTIALEYIGMNDGKTRLWLCKHCHNMDFWKAWRKKDAD